MPPPLEGGQLRVEGLGHFYADVDVPALDPDPPGADVSITIKSDIAQYVDVAPTLEALVRSRDGTYERQKISYGGDGATVCVNGNLKLVLSNPAISALDVAIGSIFLEGNYDEDGQPQPCTRIEATNPETLTPLSDAEMLAPDKVYRKTIDVTLDKDLTDKNRPLTIDARLIRDAAEVHSHKPTVELHGLKPCDPNDVDVTCELVGDLMSKFSGDYDNGSPDNYIRNKADAGGALSVRLGELDGLSYSDVGSTWTMSGSASFESCSRLLGGGCGTKILVEQNFVNDGSDALGSEASGQQDGLRVAVKAQVSGLFLSVTVPVLQSTIVQGISEVLQGGHVNPVEQSKWNLGCPAIPESNWQDNAKFWKSYGTKADYFDSLGRFEDPFPTWSDASLGWNDTGTELIFDCSRQWATSGPGTGSISYNLNGTLRWVGVEK